MSLRIKPKVSRLLPRFGLLNFSICEVWSSQRLTLKRSSSIHRYYHWLWVSERGFIFVWTAKFRRVPVAASGNPSFLRPSFLPTVFSWLSASQTDSFELLKFGLPKSIDRRSFPMASKHWSWRFIRIHGITSDVRVHSYRSTMEKAIGIFPR